MSTELKHRSITPAIGWRTRQTHHPSPSPHRRRPTAPLLKPLQHINVVTQSCPEPLLQIDDLLAGDGRRSFESNRVLYRPQSDVLSFPSNLLESLKSGQLEGKDSKVVVNVTVEGSPGPIRTMVKLGSSVEDTIKHVIEKYGEEGRSPRLSTAASSFDLHLSYFSLESLDRSSAIGEVGSRNFYLRKNSGSEAAGVGNKPNAASVPVTSEIVLVKESYHLQPPVPFVFLSAHTTHNFTKIMRKIHKLWKILGCIH